MLAQKIEEMRRAQERIIIYEKLREEFDSAGYSLLQTQMLKAFTLYRKLFKIRKVFL